MNPIGGFIRSICNAWADQRAQMFYEEDHPIYFVKKALCEVLGMMTQEELPMQNVWRVEITKEGKYLLSDFTLPKQTSRIKQLVSEQEVPVWVLESVNVLQIAENDTVVNNVGKKINGKIFYVFEPMNEG
jgi:hypothetical protein